MSTRLLTAAVMKPARASVACGALLAARRLWRGHSSDPAWARPALIGLLAATTALYLCNLASSGWANAFYSAAAQAGAENWTAFLYGSSDAANSITVDKPPASLWVMALSVRIFGLSSWSILVPEVLMGTATVGVLYAAVRRHFGAGAALLAGAVLALTPVAALMFRFNNPDALLVLLMTVAVYAVLRAAEPGAAHSSLRWMVLSGAMIGLGFLTKQLQVFLVLPALVAAFLLASRQPWPRRLLRLLAAGGSLLASAGWWIALVELVPASLRPYIGGSQSNSFLELTFGYNGLGRLNGQETGSVGGGFGGTGTGRWGATGVGRLFSESFGAQISWLIPAAVLFAAALLWWLRRATSFDLRRAQIIAWTLWLVVTGLTFSLMSGIIHEYYSVALAPAIAALVGIGGATAWRRRHTAGGSLVLGLALVASGLWSWILLDRTPDFLPWLRWAVLVLALAAAFAVLLVQFAPRTYRRRFAGRAGSTAVALAALGAVLLGPLAYTVQTVGTSHQGAIVTAGPASRLGPGGFGAVGRGAGGVRGQFQGGQLGAAGGGGGMGGAGGMGGLLGTSKPSAELVALLETDAPRYTWVAAAVGSNSAAGYQLATGDPVMPVGGFNGSDPAPTLARFQAYVAAGKIHYFIGGGSYGQQMGGSDAASEIAAWVQATFPVRQVGNTVVYDLSSGQAGNGSST